MLRRQLVLAASLMTVFGPAILIVVHTQANIGRKAYVTFSSPVALPGVTLGPGTYLFERAEPTRANVTSGSVVRVSSRDGAVVLVAAETKPTERPGGLPHDRAVVFAETQPGSAPAIAAWFPNGEPSGHEFIYASRKH